MPTCVTPLNSPPPCIPQEAEKFRLPTSGERGKQFRYLSQSDCFALPGHNMDKAEYARTRRAMDVMGFTDEEQVGELGWRVPGCLRTPPWAVCNVQRCDELRDSTVVRHAVSLHVRKQLASDGKQTC